MNPLRRAWRSLSGGQRGPAPPDLRAQLRQAIVRIREQQAEVGRQAGSAIVRQGQAEQAVRQQQLTLAQAEAQIRDAVAAAQRAADGAREDGGQAAAAPYQQTADGLRSQLAVVETARGQLERLRGDAVSNVAQAHVMLHENRASLDVALRAEVALLLRLERLERDRVIAEALRRRDRPQ